MNTENIKATLKDPAGVSARAVLWTAHAVDARAAYDALPPFFYTGALVDQDEALS